MVTRAAQMSAEQLWQLPDTGQVRRELVRGELHEMAPAGYQHGSVAMRLGWRLARHVDENQLGTVCAAETGFVLERNPDTVLAPDVAFVRAGRAPGSEAGFFEGPPDLAVEVVSASERVTDVEKKTRHWLDAGTRLVWTVWPNTRTVAVHCPEEEPHFLRSEDTLEGQDVIPGFASPVRDIFS